MKEIKLVVSFLFELHENSLFAKIDWLPRYLRFLILFRTLKLPALKGIAAVTMKYSRIPSAQMSTGAPV